MRKTNRLSRLAVVLLALVITGWLAPPSAPVLARSSLALTNSIYLGREIVVSDLDNIKENLAVAYNWKHDEYLVVWQNNWPGGNSDIYAQRISGTGEMISRFAVTYGGYNRSMPAVAYDDFNDQYLVVWVFDAFGDNSDLDIYGRIIPWEGPSPLFTEYPIDQTGDYQIYPQVAYGRVRDEFLVVFMNDQIGSPISIRGRLVKPDLGSSPDPSFDISTGTESLWYPSVAYNLARNEYLVTWDVGPGNISGARLRADGVRLGAGEIDIAGWPDDERYQSLAACRESDKYLVVWQSQVGLGNIDIYARLINGDGSLDGGPLHVSASPGYEENPAVACNQGGNTFLVAYAQETSGVTARLVDPDHSMSGIQEVIPPSPSFIWSFPAVAGGKLNFLTAWVQERPGTTFNDIHARFLFNNRVFLPMMIR